MVKLSPTHAARLLARAMRLAYSPDQPRDEDGRWTDGTGGTDEDGRWTAGPDTTGYALDTRFPRAGTHVDDLEVLDDVPNLSSISSSLDDYTVLSGVREVSIPDNLIGKKPRSYSATEQKRTEALAEELAASKQIKPLIVVVDDEEWPYVLEGGHRFDALRIIGKRKYPAIVVVDHDKRTIRDLAFNPDQPRDEDGRWTDVVDLTGDAEVFPKVKSITSGTRRFMFEPNTNTLLLGGNYTDKGTHAGDLDNALRAGHKNLGYYDSFVKGYVTGKTERTPHGQVTFLNAAPGESRPFNEDLASSFERNTKAVEFFVRHGATGKTQLEGVGHFIIGKQSGSIKELLPSFAPKRKMRRLEAGLDLLEFNPSQPRDEEGRWTAIDALPKHPSPLGDYGYVVNPLLQEGGPSDIPAWTGKKAAVEKALNDAGGFGALVARGVEEEVEIDSLRSYQTRLYPPTLRQVRRDGGPRAVVFRHEGVDWIVDGNHRLTVEKLAGATRAKVLRVDPAYKVRAAEGAAWEPSGRFAWDPDQPRDERGRWVDAGVGGLLPYGSEIPGFDANDSVHNPLVPVKLTGDMDEDDEIIREHFGDTYPPEVMAATDEIPVGRKPNIREIKISRLRGTQATLSRKKIQAYVDQKSVGGLSKPEGIAVRYGRDFIMVDGNHRAVAAALNGRSTVWIDVIKDFARPKIRGLAEAHPLVQAADAQSPRISVAVRHAFWRAKKALRSGLGLDRALRDMASALGETLPRALERAAMAGSEAAEKSLRTAAYDPEQPRDEQGRWTNEGGIAYHGTTSRYRDQILKQGLIPDTHNVYLTSSRKRAEEYAQLNAPHDQTPIVFEVRVPGDRVVEFGRTTSIKGDIHYTFPGTIPKEWLKLLEGAEDFRTAKRLPSRTARRNEEARKWARRHAAELIDDVTETTRKGIRRIVARLGNLNDAIGDIEALVLDADRAETIARTESMRAVHEGQRQLWRQGVEEGLLDADVKRAWITTPDDRLCPICEPLDGETAALDEDYVDGIAAPPAHPNCRCTEGLAFN